MEAATAATATKLPADLLTQILSWLPVISLLRFRAVCKGWYNLFQNEEFVYKHHNNQVARSNLSAIVRHGTLDQECFSQLTSLGGGETRIGKLIFSRSFPKFVTPLMIAGHANGLFYLYDSRDVLALWNPATREFRKVPLSPIKPLPGSILRFSYVVGFGFDSKTSDYKIIRFASNIFAGGESEKDQIEIYSLKSNSWKEIPCVDNVFSFGNPWNHAYNDGIYYWWAGYRRSVSCPFILCFNFADEVFEKLPPPDCGVSLEEGSPPMTVFNGMLSIVVYNPKVSKPSFDIWVMKEHGVKESWEKQMSIDYLQGCQLPLGLWGSRMFFMDEKEKLVLYDASTRKLKKVKLVGEQETWQVLNYVESIVPLDGRLGKPF